MNKILHIFSVGAFIFAVFLVWKDHNRFERTEIIVDRPLINHLSVIHPPDIVFLCGERIPLEIPDVRERFEREFYVEF